MEASLNHRATWRNLLYRLSRTGLVMGDLVMAEVTPKSPNQVQLPVERHGYQ